MTIHMLSYYMRMYLDVDEVVYIGRPKVCAINASQEEYQCNLNLITLFIPGIIIPSQSVIAYINYSSAVDTAELVTSKDYEILISRVPDILYWKSVKSLTQQEFLHNAVTIMDLQSKIKAPLFVTKSDVPISPEDEVVGNYSSTTDHFTRPFFGLGMTKTWLLRNGSCSYLDTLRAFIPCSGKIFKATKFSVLCCYSIPKLCHYTFPELKWTTVSDDHLLLSAFPAGVAPNGEVLYIGRTQHVADCLVPGYIVPSEHCLHLGWECQEYWYDSKYEILELVNEDFLEWGVYSRGKIPTNAAVVGYHNNERIFVGRTVVDSDILLGMTWHLDKINLPEDAVSNTQLVGKLQHCYDCLHVPWDHKEYLYQLYEVLMVKMRPKSLQQLCRDVIIVATLAVPDRVDKLSLPRHLREYCKVSSY